MIFTRPRTEVDRNYARRLALIFFFNLPLKVFKFVFQCEKVEYVMPSIFHQYQYSLDLFVFCVTFFSHAE